MKTNRKTRKHAVRRKLRTTFIWLVTAVLIAFMPELTAENSPLRHAAELLGFESGRPVHITDEGPGLTVHVIDVGEGLAMLLESKGEYMVFDGGGRDSSDHFISELRRAGVKEISYLAASHFDEDHLAGLTEALRSFKVSHVLAPSYDPGTWTSRSFKAAVAEKGLSISTPERGESFALGSCTVTCLSTPGTWHEEENDYSMVFRVTCADRSILLTGDATWAMEQDILNTGLNVKSDILVVGHHGSSGSSDREFLQAVSPTTAVISCGADNEYGHPAASVMQKLEDEYIHILRTDLQGDLTMYTDGSRWAYDPKPCDDYSSRVPQGQYANSVG